MIHSPLRHEVYPTNQFEAFLGPPGSLLNAPMPATNFFVLFSTSVNQDPPYFMAFGVTVLKIVWVK